MKLSMTYFIILLSLAACNPAEDTKNYVPDNNYIKANISFENLIIRKTVYVPIYSEIYHISASRKIPLTATLSIRNTTFEDTLYINKIDYYDSGGKILKNYIKETILLLPMNSTEFVVEKEDKGGVGANFIVEYGHNGQFQPIIQSVMIGTSGQQGLSFITEGVEIKGQKK